MREKGRKNRNIWKKHNKTEKAKKHQKEAETSKKREKP